MSTAAVIQETISLESQEKAIPISPQHQNEQKSSTPMRRKFAKKNEDFWIHYKITSQVEKVDISRIFIVGQVRGDERRKQVYSIREPQKGIPIMISGNDIKRTGLKLIATRVDDPNYQVMIKIHCINKMTKAFTQHWFAIRYNRESNDWRAKFIIKNEEREQKVEREKLFYIRVNLPNEVTNYDGATNTYHRNATVAITIDDWHEGIEKKHAANDETTDAPLTRPSKEEEVATPIQKESATNTINGQKEVTDEQKDIPIDDQQ